MERTSFTIDKSIQPTFDTLSKRYGMSKKALFESMLNYFDTLGVDPRELDGSTFSKEFTKLKKDISGLRETTVSFIRQQEKGLLLPLVNQVNTNTQQLMNYLAEEPLTVKHLEEIKSIFTSSSLSRTNTNYSRQVDESLKKSELTESDIIEQDEQIKTKAEVTISHAKELFKSFLETGKKSVGKGIFFEEGIVNMYKNQFDLLKLK